MVRLDTGALAHAVRAAEAGLDVRLTGLPGSGRSTLLAAIGDQLRRRSDLAVIHLRGNPFGAASADGSRTESGARDHGATSLEELLSEARAERRVALLDDAEHLDRRTAGLLWEARHRDRLVVVQALRTGAATAHRAAHLDLPMRPLGYEGILDVVAATVEGNVSPALARAVSAMSGGLPGLARDLVRSARVAGVVRVEDGRWCARRPLWDPRLSGVVTPYVEPLSSDARELLEHLAAHDGERIALPDATAAASPYRELVAHGLLRRAEDGSGGSLALYPPVLVDAHARPAPVEEPAAGQRAFGSRTTGALTGPAGTEREWRRAFSDLHRTWRDTPTATAGAAYVRAALALGERIDIAPSAYRTAPGTTAERARLLAEVATAAWCREGATAGRSAFSRAAEELPSERLFFAHRAALLDVQLSGANDRPPPTEAPRTVLSAASGHLLHLEQALGRGDIETARTHRDLLSASTEAWAATTAEAYHGLVLLGAGESAEAARWARSHLETAIARFDMEQVAIHGYVATTALFVLGREHELDAALERLLPVLAPARTPFSTHVLGILCLAAANAAVRGDRRVSTQLERHCADLLTRSGPFPGQSLDWLRARIRHDRAALAAMATTVQEDIAAERYGSAIFLAVECLQMDADALADLDPDALRERVPGSPPFLAMLRYASALRAGSPAALEAASLALAGAGMHRYALHAKVAALGESESTERSAVVRETLRWAAEHHMGSHIVRTALSFGKLLSGREREVAMLARTGLSSQEIADRLSLSRRTVENHLARIFKKVGIASRSELAAIDLGDPRLPGP